MSNKPQKHLRILIAETDPVIALDLAEMLTNEGHTVIGTADTLRGVGLLIANKAPGLMLLNVQLNDGPTHQIARSTHVPVVFITAHDGYELPADLQDVPRLSKPFTPDALVCLAVQLGLPAR